MIRFSIKYNKIPKENMNICLLKLKVSSLPPTVKTILKTSKSVKKLLFSDICLICFQ